MEMATAMHSTQVPQLAHSVLVVDDRFTTRTTVARLLRQQGYTVREASNGEMALRLLYISPQPLVALVDLWMPEADGVALLRSVTYRRRPLTRHAYIAMSSPWHILPPAFAAHLMWLGAPLLAKPVVEATLLTTVARAAARLAD